MTRILPAANLKEAALDYPLPELAHLDQFVALIGTHQWRERLDALQKRIAASNRHGSLPRQRHSLELGLDRLLNRNPGSGGKPSLGAAEARLAQIAAEGVVLSQQL